MDLLIFALVALLIVGLAAFIFPIPGIVVGAAVFLIVVVVLIAALKGLDRPRV